jgi:sugar-specific transcriptional regulator TrmB
MANAEKTLYTAGNPLTYEPVDPECAYTELDRENSRLLFKLSITRGQLKDTIRRAERAEVRAFWTSLGLGLYVAGTVLTVAYYYFTR